MSVICVSVCDVLACVLCGVVIGFYGILSISPLLISESGLLLFLKGGNIGPTIYSMGVYEANKSIKNEDILVPYPGLGVMML
jgi:hypothetical protein